MKIKQTRQVRLDELISYIIKNEVISSDFESNRGSDLVVDINGDLNFYGKFNYNDLFTITEEVEITEETELNIVTVSNDHETYAYENTSIYDLLSEDNVLFKEYQAKFIYLQNEDGSIGELIWSKERGLVD